jgi:hypothetical protein
LIVSAGENVYASVVEAVLVRLAGVSEACVQFRSARSKSARSRRAAVQRHQQGAAPRRSGNHQGVGVPAAEASSAASKVTAKPGEGKTASAGLLSKSDRKRENIEGAGVLMPGPGGVLA